MIHGWINQTYKLSLKNMHAFQNINNRFYKRFTVGISSILFFFIIILKISLKILQLNFPLSTSFNSTYIFLSITYFLQIIPSNTPIWTLKSWSLKFLIQLINFPCFFQANYFTMPIIYMLIIPSSKAVATLWKYFYLLYCLFHYSISCFSSEKYFSFRL